jgi:hypothetical protein
VIQLVFAFASTIHLSVPIVKVDFPCICRIPLLTVGTSVSAPVHMMFIIKYHNTMELYFADIPKEKVDVLRFLRVFFTGSSP